MTWSTYQRIIAAYCRPDHRRGKTMLASIIDSPRRGVPVGWKNWPNWAVPPCTDAATTSWPTSTTTSPTGPTEAINGRLGALRRNALGFRNLTYYRLRSLLHCGNLIQQIDAL